MTAADDGRKPRRVMLALVALAVDLPVPTTVAFGGTEHDIFCLGFERVADGVAWAAYLGKPATPYVKDELRYLGHRSVTRWHGWLVQLNAAEPVEHDGELEPDTIEELRGIAGPAADEALP